MSCLWKTQKDRPPVLLLQSVENTKGPSPCVTVAVCGKHKRTVPLCCKRTVPLCYGLWKTQKDRPPVFLFAVVFGKQTCYDALRKRRDFLHGISV